jgi:hypothetical protein
MKLDDFSPKVRSTLGISSQAELDSKNSCPCGFCGGDHFLVNCPGVYMQSPAGIARVGEARSKLRAEWYASLRSKGQAAGNPAIVGIHRVANAYDVLLSSLGVDDGEWVARTCRISPTTSLADGVLMLDDTLA